MQKPARFILNFLLSFTLLSVSFSPAQAAPPAQSSTHPLALPSQPIDLFPDRPPHSKPLATSPTAPDQTALAWQVPIPDTCVVLSEMDPNTLEYDLYAYTPQTGQFLPVFITPADEDFPRFNHGCTRIVYTLTPLGAANEDLYAVNPDSSGLVRLTQNQGNNYAGAWSPDGSKIAFTSDRDGQPEIYTMNADGTNQVRRTYNGGDAYHNYDGMPDWSPDGKKIAFVSNQYGTYAIWVMNADSSIVSGGYSSQGNCFHPHWSPDGGWILFDCGAQFNRLYKTTLDGSAPYHIFVGDDYSDTVDEYARGWSPDGTYIYYTQVTLTLVNQIWYWVKATNSYVPDPNWTTVPGKYLSPGTTDWSISWETIDNQIPVFQFDPLPAVSPSPFTLSWSVQDISHYHMMYCIDAEEKDNDWWGSGCIPETSETFEGYGGHTYKFRGYARDGFLNQSTMPDGVEVFTTIESTPPKTHLLPLPPLNRGLAVQLDWTGYDPGGSGIKNYDVQYRDPASTSSWTDLLTTTTLTSYAFGGAMGHTYEFRVRGTDGAVNVEQWANSAPPVTTTLYASRVTGALYDSSGNPIPGVTPMVNAPYYHNPPTGLDGSFGTYFLTIPLGLTLSWNKAGYGTQTPFYYNMTADQHVNVYLPPADDVVVNGGFESGSLGDSDWTPVGAVLPVAIASPVHSGHFAAQLGNIAATGSAPQPQSVQQPSDGQISQTIQVPPLARHPGLSFLYQLAVSAASGDNLSVEVASGDTSTQVFSTHQSTSDWTHTWVDLSPWAGQSVKLTFKFHYDPSIENAVANLDEITLGPTGSDAWLQASFPAHAIPGGQVTIPLTFGNHSRVPADGSQLTLTLPAGVTFVSASVAPSAISPNLTWDVGDLPPQSGPTVIWVTLHLDPSLPTFTTFIYSASLSVSSTELEIANNTSSGSINTSLAVFLPLLES